MTRFLLVAVGLMACSTVFAAGDPESGQAKSGTCTACHGPDGNSVTSIWPKLAGQHEGYLARQMDLYKSGQRENAVMTGMVAVLNESDIEDLAAYYAAQELKPGVADEALVEAGRVLYQGGNAPTGVPACMACHGPGGSGNPLSGYPRLNGQHADYLKLTLTAFRDGAVWGAGDDANAVMAGAAKNLTDAEIEAVSSYLEGLHSQ